MIDILCKAVFLLQVLKAFDASMSRMHSAKSSSKNFLIECIAASTPDSTPEHTWRGPAECCMSTFRTFIADLHTSLLSVSPIPIGLAVPSGLASGINLQALNVSMTSGSTNVVHIILVRSAMLSHSSFDATLCFLGQRIELSRSESRPDGPAAP